ncbi:predicted protein [Arabidopsis lyrata subsp. lyrata]|uniref:Predicted protein n=1 Tax=Arabidopsis lyrata subsp. lyrata TaxID=81972 RepID=D7KGK8_ARALL|nr:predicted protein [Arabidopsis lyrata subsp. lyrata]
MHTGVRDKKRKARGCSSGKDEITMNPVSPTPKKANKTAVPQTPWISRRVTRSSSKTGGIHLGKQPVQTAEMAEKPSGVACEPPTMVAIIYYLKHWMLERKAKFKKELIRELLEEMGKIFEPINPHTPRARSPTSPTAECNKPPTPIHISDTDSLHHSDSKTIPPDEVHLSVICAVLSSCVDSQ